LSAGHEEAAWLVVLELNSYASCLQTDTNVVITPVKIVNNFSCKLK
jgi:hypothetical protein